MRRPLALLVTILVTAVVAGLTPTPADAGGGPVVITVTTTADVVDGGDGVTSLREALDQASDDGVPTEVVLQALTYQLTSCGIGGPALYHEDTHSLRLEGNGATLEQTCPEESVLVDDGPLLVLRDLTVTGGSDGPSAVFGHHGDVDGVTFEGNTGGSALRLDGTDQTNVVTNSVFRDNHTPLGGGGILSFGELDVSDSVFEGNTAVNEGGAIAGYSDVTVRRSTIGPDNEAQTGGGVSGVAEVEVLRSTVIGNVAEAAGGVWANEDLDVRNTTVVDNEAVFQGGGLRSTGFMTLDHVTVVDNRAGTDGANIMVQGGGTIANSVVSGLVAGNQSCALFSGSETFPSGGHNLFEPFCTTPVGSDLTGDPRLGPLRDNGPNTGTMFPLAGSPLVDAIPTGQCTLGLDQRGIARPFGAGCDIGATEAVYPAHGFGDVPAWVEAAVRWMTSTVNDPQLMTGITPTTFAPDDPITRGQVIRMLYREAGSPDVSGLPAHGFDDVPAWIEDAVRWAKANEIATGITPTTFVPDDPITRAQVVRMKYRLAGSPPVGALPPHGFSDVPAWVQHAVQWAANTANPLPLITGYPDDTFRPNLDITRAQVVRMDHRLAITPEAWADPGSAPSTLPFVAP